MPVSLKIHGILELKQALAELPESLAEHGSTIVMQTGHEAVTDIAAAYPTGPTGNLKAGVKLQVLDAGRHGVRVKVRSAPHAWLWEHGSEARHTKMGASRGRMPKPPAPVFIPRMIRARAAMWTQFASLLERYGLTPKAAA